MQDHRGCVRYMLLGCYTDGGYTNLFKLHDCCDFCAFVALSLNNNHSIMPANTGLRVVLFVGFIHLKFGNSREISQLFYKIRKLLSIEQVWLEYLPELNCVAVSLWR